MLVMTLSTPPTPDSSVTAVLVFPGTVQAVLFMYLHCLCLNTAPHLQRTTTVYGPSVILYVTLSSQFDVVELMSRHAALHSKSCRQSGKLCLSSGKQVSIWPDVNSAMLAEWCQKKRLNDNECVQSQDEANSIPVFSHCSSRNSILAHFISISLFCINHGFVSEPAKQHSFAAWNHQFVHRCCQNMSDKHFL